MLSKMVAVVFLLSILSSLAMGLVYMMKDKGNSDRAVKALTFRIGFSITLFVIFIIASATGLITPHGALPPGN
ncbi:MAG: twin transmembrane helix small protein [Gammaproteobacteria bacterium]|nr:twin transmembrane helix small protein [Gammaproteobacteria bacterium]